MYFPKQLASIEVNYILVKHTVSAIGPHLALQRDVITVYTHLFDVADACVTRMQYRIEPMHAVNSSIVGVLFMFIASIAYLLSHSSSLYRINTRNLFVRLTCFTQYLVNFVL